MKVSYLMRNVRRDAMTILLLLVSGFGCATIPRNAGLPPIERGPGETLKRLSALMQAPKAPRPAGVPAKAIPAPSSMVESGAGAHFKYLLTKMETPHRGSVPSPEPPPAAPSAPSAPAVALLSPPAKSEEIAQPPPQILLPLPQDEEARPREPTPSQPSGMETATLAPAPLAAEDPSKASSVPSPEPPPAVPSAPSAPAVALLSPPVKSEEIAQPPPQILLPLPQDEEARPREPTPSQPSGMETATLAPAPLAAEDPSKASSVPSPEPPPAAPSAPSATDPLRLEKEQLSATKSYRIGPEDVLRVSVWQNPELTMDNVTVRPDGNISLPLIKEIHATNLTPMELSDVITRNLKEYLKDPDVTVTVTQVNSRKIFLIGNVLRPGSYLLRHDMTVLQALSLAGGFTPFASPRDMKLIRDVGGKQESRSINYYKMIKGTEVDDYMLKPGDTIVIP